MSILLPALAVAFAAFCVWLAVRIVNRRTPPKLKPLMITAVVVAVVAYPLSIGPVAYLVLTGRLPEQCMWIYRPLVFASRNSKAIRTAIYGYTEYWTGSLGAFMYAPR
jgi:hypothetical protein